MSLEKELRDGADAVAAAKAGGWVYYAVCAAVGFLVGLALGLVF